MNTTQIAQDAKYIKEYKKKYKEEPEVKWSVLKRVHAYNEVTQNYKLCREEKYQIISFPDSSNLTNIRVELVAKCRHESKYLLCHLASD